MEFPTDFAGFIQWAFYALLTGIVITIRTDFKQTNESLQSLSTALAVLTDRLGSFEKSLDRLDERLEKLEDMRHN